MGAVLMGRTAVIVLALIWGFALGRLTGPASPPYCPAEDSCRVDYHAGAWHIEEVR